VANALERSAPGKIEKKRNGRKKTGKQTAFSVAFHFSASAFSNEK